MSAPGKLVRSSRWKTARDETQQGNGFGLATCHSAGCPSWVHSGASSVSFSRREGMVPLVG